MLNSNPLVSIVIPVYNQEKKLNRSLLAAANQTYKNIEIIVVNDGSTDNSQSIIDAFLSTDNRIKSFAKPNGGLVDATVFGIDRCNGEYVCFLDSDDTIGDDFISNFINGGNDNDDIISAGFNMVTSNGNIEHHLVGERIFSNSDEICYLKENFILDNHIICTARWNKMFKIEIVKNVAVEMAKNLDITIGEDALFCLVALQFANRIHSLNIINSYYYFTNDNTSMMHNLSVELFYKKSYVLYTRLQQYLEKYNMPLIQADLALYQELKNIYFKTKSSKNLFISSHKFLMSKCEYVNSLHVAYKNLGIKDKLMSIAKLYFPHNLLYIMYYLK